MKRKIVLIDDKLYLMDFEKQQFYTVEEIGHDGNNFRANHGLTLFCCIIEEEKKWGVVNREKEEVIPCIYDYIDINGVRNKAYYSQKRRANRIYPIF